MAGIAVEAAIEASITIIGEVVKYLIFGNQRNKPHLDFDSIIKDCLTMQAYLKDTEGMTQVTEGSKDRIQQVRDIAFQIEDAFEEFMLEVPEQFHEHNISKLLHDWFHFFKRRKALGRLYSRMETIMTKMKQIEDLDRFRVLPSPQASSCWGRKFPDEVNYPPVKELVGIEKRRKELRNLIKNRESGQMVISVIGSRGSGKTTLIKQVYEKQKKKFRYSAWCSVPHPVNGIVETICAEFKIEFPQGTDAIRKLHSYLKEKRYVIVLDGIWSNDDWNFIQSVLPKGRSGSLTIISSHKQDVASYCVHPCNLIYKIGALTREEGWELFCKETFRGKECPQHLVKISEKILETCGGLPPAIVAAAKVLSNKPQTTSEFEKLHKSLGHELGSSDPFSVMGKILLQSYLDLSYNLRCCFLYFCNFPEDYYVTRGRLIRLWIAEAFVKEIGNKTGEDVANEYLNELIQMDLVHVSGRDLQGRVTSCRAQNLAREFIIPKSEDENFCKVFTGKNKSLAEPPRRLSLQCNFRNNLIPMTDLSRVRTLMTFHSESCTALTVGKMLNSFRLLRVLDLEDSALKSFPQQVVILTLLRYLSLKNTEIKSVPGCITKLQSLVTLDLRQTCVKKLPKKIFKLRKLLYLLVDWRDENLTRVGAEMPPGIGSLTSLQKLSLVNANKKNHRIIRELGNLVELRKLRISELERESGRDLCASIQNMEHLSSLYVTSAAEEEFLDLDDVLDKPPLSLCSLYLGGRLQKIPQWINSLHSLAKIYLEGSKMMNSPLGAIQAVPSLLELRLVDAYIGEELEFETKCFQKLMILEIEELNNLRKVVVGKEVLPELQKLVLRRCERLNEAPAGIHELIKLEEILLYDMPEKLATRLSNATSKRTPFIRSFHSMHSS